MITLSKDVVYGYINKSYPRLEYECDSDFKLFDFEIITVDKSNRELYGEFRVKDQKSYSIFPPMELVHGILISNMMIICFGEATGEFVSALIKNMDITTNRPVFVDRPFKVELKFSSLQKRYMRCEARFNSDSFIIITEIFAFSDEGKLEEFVIKKRIRDDRYSKN